MNDVNISVQFLPNSKPTKNNNSCFTVNRLVKENFTDTQRPHINKFHIKYYLFLTWFNKL